MLKAIIYCKTKNAMQSGMRVRKPWQLEIINKLPNLFTRQTGVLGGTQPTDQLDLSFETKEAAIKYAESKKLEFTVKEKCAPEKEEKRYADNFCWNCKLKGEM